MLKARIYWQVCCCDTFWFHHPLYNATYYNRGRPSHSQSALTSHQATVKLAHFVDRFYQAANNKNMHRPVP